MPDEETVADMLARYFDGEGMPSIARSYGVSKQRVHQVIKAATTAAQRRERNARRKATNATRRVKYQRDYWRHRRLKPCEWCGEMTTRPRYCSDEHRDAARKARTQRQWAEHVLRYPDKYSEARQAHARRLLAEEVRPQTEG